MKRHDLIAKSLTYLLYLLLASLIGGFFVGFDSITNPSSVPVLNPITYIALNTLLFVPAALFSLVYNLFYVRFLNANKLSKKFAPSLGLWASAIFGTILVLFLIMHTITTRTEIIEQYELGQLSFEEREIHKADLEDFILNSFYSLLILAAIFSPLADLIYLKKKGVKITFKIILILYSLSFIYHLLIFAWRIGLFYVVNIFLFFALWS